MKDKRFRKLVVFDSVILTKYQKAVLNKSAEIVEYYPRTFSEEETIKKIGDAEAVITGWTELTKKVLQQTNLEYIDFWGHWYTHRVDTEEVRKQRIHIDYIPDYGTDAVAELVFAAIHERARNLCKQIKNTRRGSWLYENLKTGKVVVQPEDILTWNLTGKCLGIIGLGRIGKRVAEIGHGYRMKSSYYSRTRKPERVDRLYWVQYQPLEDLIKTSDIITVHVSPDAPKNLLGKKELELIRQDALFINTSVGHVVDESALIELLKKQRFNAFLDVYQGFPPRKELKDLPNVTLTYRAGWYTKEAIEWKGDVLVGHMQDYLQKK